jgi:hypothetical protein
MADFGDVQVASPLAECIAAADEGADAAGHRSVANAALVCQTWRASCTAWRATVRSLELRELYPGTLRVVARFYPALENLKLLADCYARGCGYDKQLSTSLDNDQQRLVLHCSLLVAGCPQLVLLDVVHSGVDFSPMGKAALLLSRIRPALEFRCKRVLHVRTTTASDITVYFTLKSTTLLGTLFDALCERQGVARSQVYFTFAGTRRLLDADTAYSLTDGLSSAHFDEVILNSDREVELQMREPIRVWVVGAPETPESPTGE